MTTELERELTRLSHGQYVCLLYETASEQLAAAVPFIKNGLSQNARCIYVADDRTVEEVTSALLETGLDVAREQQRGGLQILTKEAAYLRRGEFSPQAMLDFLGQAESEALAGKFSGLRFTGEMTWALGPEVGCERLIEFEAQLGEMKRNTRSIVLSQYNRRRFDAPAIYQVLRTHRWVILGDQLCDNPFYEPPEMVLSQNQMEGNALLKAQRVDWWIAQMRRARTIEQERERTDRDVRFQASLIDRVRNAVITTDRNGNIIQWNKFAEAIYQWRPEEVLGKPILEVTVPDAERAKAEAILAQVQREGYWEGEFQVTRKDGSTFFAHVIEALIKNDQEEPLGYVGFSKDITDRKRAEAELRSRNEILQTIFDRVPVMIVFTDESCRVLLVNRCFERTTGWSLEEARARNLIAELYPDPAEYQKAFEFFRNPPEDWSLFRARTKDSRWIDTSWANVLLADGTSVGIGLDVTERKQTEAEREILHQKLLAGQELLETLSRRLIDAQEAERQHLAHELHDEIGQVLTTVNLNLEALRSKVDPSGMSRLEDGLRVVNTAIEQVRDMSLNLRPASLDLLGLETALRGHLSRQAARAKVAVKFSSNLLGQRLPATLETVCFRVVQEALTNVIRHAHAVHCWIELTQSEGQIQIVVRDDGTGFDPAAAKERALRGEGFGLLSMLERVNLFGGQIEIESSPGRGTSIRACFPLNEDGARLDEERKK